MMGGPAALWSLTHLRRGRKHTNQAESMGTTLGLIQQRWAFIESFDPEFPWVGIDHRKDSVGHHWATTGLFKVGKGHIKVTIIAQHRITTGHLRANYIIQCHSVRMFSVRGL